MTAAQEIFRRLAGGEIVVIDGGTGTPLQAQQGAQLTGGCCGAGPKRIGVPAARLPRRAFDLAAELHLKFDAVAVAYRKAMRTLGLATSAAIGNQPT